MPKSSRNAWQGQIVSIGCAISERHLMHLLLSRLVKQVEADERDRQLNLATDEAIRKIASDLSNVFERKNHEP